MCKRVLWNPRNWQRVLVGSFQCYILFWDLMAASKENFDFVGKVSSLVSFPTIQYYILMLRIDPEVVQSNIEN